MSVKSSLPASFALSAWRFSPALAKGEKLGAFAITEPSGGTNWQMTLRTRAMAEGDGYLVNGSKCFTSNAGEADIYIVMTRTDPAKGPMGFSTLIIEPRTLAHLENVQRAIADMTVTVEAARLIAYRAAFPAAKEGPDPLIPLAAMFCNKVAVEVSGKAVELHGGYGCTRDFPVGRYFRDAKALSLQKTSEYVRTMAGKMLLGIPMGPPPGAGGPPR